MDLEPDAGDQKQGITEDGMPQRPVRCRTRSVYQKLISQPSQNQSHQQDDDVKSNMIFPEPSEPKAGKCSKNRKMQEIGGNTVLELDTDDLHRWCNVGLTHHLDTSTHIALFLLAHYEKSMGQADPRKKCQNCGHSLLFFCPYCKELSPPPTSPPTSPAITTVSPSANKTIMVGQQQGLSSEQQLPFSSSHPLSLPTTSAVKVTPPLTTPSSLAPPPSGASPSAERLADTGERKAESAVQCCSEENLKVPLDELQPAGMDSIRTEEDGFKSDCNLDEEVRRSNLDFEVKRNHLDLEEVESTSVTDLDLEDISSLNVRMEWDLPEPAIVRVNAEQEHQGEQSSCIRQNEKMTKEEQLKQPCPHCGTVCHRHDSLEEHSAPLDQHTGKKSFFCFVCQMSFSRLSSGRRSTKRLKNHFKCKYCHAVFSQFSELSVHLQTHTGHKPYLCRVCGKHFKQSGHLSDHLRSHSGEKPFLCQQCGARFGRAHGLKLHQRQHTGEKPYVCGQCGKAYYRQEYLVVHQRTHTREKAFLCQQCGSAFSSLGVLAHHVNRAHSTAGSHVCRVCGKTFMEISQLVAHNQNTHAAEKPYQCKTCGATFAHATSLTRHHRSHTGEKPYRCKLCPALFARAGHFNVHMRTHTGEKPFWCSVCQQGFSSAGTLKVHRRCHTGEKPFACEICGTSYTQKRNLMIHIMKKHPSS